MRTSWSGSGRPGDPVAHPSLEGNLSNLKTFTADGMEVRPHVTVSYFVRF
jgi:hypothetical protein